MNLDDEAGETMRVHPHETPGYESPPSGPPYRYPLPPPPPRQRSIAPLVMVTVMVLTVVAGAVTIVYLLTGDRGARAEPRAEPRAAVASASPSASPAGAVDTCVTGEWQGAATRWEDAENGTSMSGAVGPVYRLRADTTGEIDFGSGLTLTGTLEGVKTELMYIGKVTFRYATAGGTLSYGDIRIDARVVTFQGGRIVGNVRMPAEEFDPDTYSCAGDLLTITSDGETDQYRRR